MLRFYKLLMLYYMKLSKQKIIIIDGPTSAGKTTTANLLYKRLKHTAITGIDYIKWFVSGFSCTKKENQMTANIVLTMCRRYIHYGLSIIIEQCFREKKVMDPYLNLAKRNHIPLFIYELYAPKKILLDRNKHRLETPPERKAPLQRVLMNINSYPHKPYAKIRSSFDSSELSTRQIVNRIIKDIKLAF